MSSEPQTRDGTPVEEEHDVRCMKVTTHEGEQNLMAHNDLNVAKCRKMHEA